MAIIIPGKLYWPALDETERCEVGECGKQAYKTCDHSFNHCGCIKLWKGCGRKMCMTHCNLTIAKNMHAESWLVGYHCSDTTCSRSFAKGN